MYRSTLLINVGDNPDRPRPGRLWLRNIYHVHQRLSMAFPTRQQRAADPKFLRPFDPDGFERPRFLFRIDNILEDDSPRAVILVQSEAPPDWVYAFQNARPLLAAEPETRDYDPAFSAGDKLRFRIRVNLSKKSKRDVRTPRDGTDKAGRPKDQGKRVAFTWEKGRNPDEAIREWFAAKGAPRGFELRACNVMHLGWIAGWRPKSKTQREDSDDENSIRRMKFRSALLEGTLAVTDAPAFAKAVASGIGPAKAFGFGLLSIAPVR